MTPGSDGCDQWHNSIDRLNIPVRLPETRVSFGHVRHRQRNLFVQIGNKYKVGAQDRSSCVMIAVLYNAGLTMRYQLRLWPSMFDLGAHTRSVTRQDHGHDRGISQQGQNRQRLTP